MKINKDFKTILLKDLQAGEIDTESFPKLADMKLEKLTIDEKIDLSKLMTKILKR